MLILSATYCMFSNVQMQLSHHLSPTQVSPDTKCRADKHQRGRTSHSHRGMNVKYAITQMNRVRDRENMPSIKTLQQRHVREGCIASEDFYVLQGQISDESLDGL